MKDFRAALSNARRALFAGQHRCDIAVPFVEGIAHGIDDRDQLSLRVLGVESGLNP